jgi:hypothetical protein
MNTTHTYTLARLISGGLSLSGQTSADGVSASEPTSNRYMKFRAIRDCDNILQTYINSTDFNKCEVVYPHYNII